jgi:hypothetical protein
MMDKATKMQISVGFLDLEFIASTKISRHSGLVNKSIANAMNNDYVVGAYYINHWVTVIICMKFKEV